MIDKIANPAAAANAYAATAKAAAPAVPQTGLGQPSFADLLRTSVGDSISTMRAGETMSARAVTGDASLPEVVQAVTAAELTLQTVVAVRDRLINAYQEIMRTQI